MHDDVRRAAQRLCRGVRVQERSCEHALAGEKRRRKQAAVAVQQPPPMEPGKVLVAQVVPGISERQFREDRTVA
jgi:hypothetical protein